MSHVLHPLSWPHRLKTTTTGKYSSSAHSQHLHPLPPKSTNYLFPGGRRGKGWAQGRTPSMSREPAPPTQAHLPLLTAQNPVLTFKKITAFRLTSVPLSQEPITENQVLALKTKHPNHTLQTLFTLKKYPEFTHTFKPQENLRIYQEIGQLQLILETPESTLH